jgi:protoporphyrinogen oxidase
MKIGIIGAGISGLSAARLLLKDHEVTVFERASVPGGIARPKMINGVSYHTTGGHCFNSKHKEVIDFVFKEVLPESNWHRIIRKSSIQFREIIVPYPIEYSVRQIHERYPDIAERVVLEFLSADSTRHANNLDEWFRIKFGDTLAEEYFIPYNKKIWSRDPKEMSHEWVKEKLPIPNKKSFTASLFIDQRDKMPHAEFFYPNSNSQISFIDSLAKGVNVFYNYEIKSIEGNDVFEEWTVNGEHTFDLLISTIPLNILPKIIKNCPNSVIKAAEKLRYNRVSTMLWESKETDSTWTYLPSSTGIFHRYIHIGNFFDPKANYTITESIGERNESEMIKCGKMDPHLIRPIDFNVSDHAYVVFDDQYRNSTAKIFEYLQQVGIKTLGRFGQWEYFNMDICIYEAMKLAVHINQRK